MKKQQKKSQRDAAGKSRRDEQPRSVPKAMHTGADLSRTEKSVLVAIAAFLVLRGVAGMTDLSGMRFWGLDFFSTLEGGFVPLLLWVPLIFLFPPVAGMIAGKRGSATSGARDDDSPSAMRIAAALLLTVAAGVAAWTINVGYAFLGDGTWYPAELVRSMSIPGYANSMIKPSAWLTGLLLDGMARIFRPEDIRLPFVIAGTVGAVIAAGAVFFGTRKERLRVSALAAVLLLGASGTLLFLGYIELYALVYALSIAYLVTGWQVLRGHAPVWLPGVLLLGAMLFGASAVVWAPSYLLLLHWKARGEEGAFPLRVAATVLMLLPVAGVIALYALTGTASDSGYLVAVNPYERMVEGLSTGWQRYVLLAPERWADLGNALLLTMGAMAFVLPVLLFSARRKHLLRHHEVLFGATAAAGGLVLLLFGNTFLGLARDWDVAAFAVLGCVFLVFVLLIVLDERSTQRVRLIVPALAAAVLSQLLLWVMVNTDEDASARRFERIAAMDAGLLLPMNTFTAYENLRKFYLSGREEAEYFRVMRRLVETGYRRDVTYAEYLSAILKLRDPQAAAREWEWLMGSLLADARHQSAKDSPTGADAPSSRAEAPSSGAKNPPTGANASPDAAGSSSMADGGSVPEAPPRFFREFAVRALLSAWQTGRRDLVDRYADAFGSALPVWPERGLLDLLMFPREDAAEARAVLAASTDENTDDAFLMMTAGSLSRQYGDLSAAAAYYDRALEREPSSYASWYLVVARFHLEARNDTARARSVLESCIANASGTEEARQAASLLQSLP